MYTDIFWLDTAALARSGLPGALGTAPRPRGGEWLAPELQSWRARGVSSIVSLLTAAEAMELALVDERHHAEACGMTYTSIPVEDRALPERMEAIHRVALTQCALLREGRSVVAHCRAGIGRSSMFAVAVLVCAGWSAADAVSAIEAARGRTIPDTRQQRAWMDDFEAWHRASRLRT